jgi:hypothetical protein
VARNAGRESARYRGRAKCDTARRALRKPLIATPWNSNRRSAGHFVGEDAERLSNLYQDANSLHGSDRASSISISLVDQIFDLQGLGSY